ncbi:glucose-6-Phosphatase [Musca autumnalis]|uniref:glucose-6-Phosphatase n=1 Tax=Musca autumnalis TaxID=221902 RepID=UPI003CE9316F
MELIPLNLTYLYELEININRNIQKQMRFTEQWLRDINTYLDPQMVMDAWIPLLGAFSHKLLVRLAVSASILNVFTSLFKWIFPEYRPIWWLREFESKYKYRGFNLEANTCDTSAGFPSSHAITFTAFAFIFFHWLLVKLNKRCDMSNFEKYIWVLGFVSLPLGILWTARLYFLTEFLHQCIAGSLLALFGVHLFNHYSSHLLKLKKWSTVLLVLLLGVVPVGVYFAMIYLVDMDPHWSVRMAFKWCSEVTLMRHEAGPIYVLFRDFGYLLGVALSCPLLQNYKNNRGSHYKRQPATAILMFLNITALQNTPKHMGRWIFLVYEFIRNCIHSYTLLTILPKISN